MFINEGGILLDTGKIASSSDCCCGGEDPCCYCHNYPSTPIKNASSSCHPFKYFLFDVDLTLSTYSFCPNDSLTVTLTITNNNAGTEVIDPFIELAKFGKSSSISFSSGGSLSSTSISELPCDIFTYVVTWPAESFASGETKSYTLTIIPTVLNRKWSLLSSSPLIYGSFMQGACFDSTSWAVYFVDTTPTCDEFGPEDPEEPPPPVEPPGPSSISCPQRSKEPVRLMTSDLCGSRGKDLPVYSCSIHGECTHGKVCKAQDPSVKICIGCEDGPWSP